MLKGQKRTGRWNVSDEVQRSVVDTTTEFSGAPWQINQASRAATDHTVDVSI